MIIRAGVMPIESLRRTASDSFADFGAYLVSVEAVVGMSARPHFDIVLPDLSERSLATLVSCFDEPIANPGRRPGSVFS